MTIDRLVRPLRDRIQMMIGRAVVAGSNDDPQLQELQVELLADEAHDAVEHFQPYGFAARPHVGAEGVMLSAGGLRSHGILLAVADRRYRMRGLKDGEVALYDDQGQSVLIGRDGIVVKGRKLDMVIEGDIAIEGQNVSLKGDSVYLDTEDLKLGHGATLQAARKTDAVAGGVISGGSTKVKIA